LDAVQVSEPPPQVKAGFRFSGHETFPLRIAWLPKAVKAIVHGLDPLTNVDEGIAKLGLGKNMVEALRCWIDAFQVATWTESGWKLTRVGQLVFQPKSGLDPYLEDHSTNWLLHWLICTTTRSPFFAWECLFNRWPSSEFSVTPVLEAFRKASADNPKPASEVTLRQHWEVFLHSYRPPRNANGEDHLDSALSVLGLIREMGDTQNAVGKWEPRYEFDMSRRAAIPQELFTFFLHDWWNRVFAAEQTVPLYEVVAGNLSPGRLLKMQESEVVHRLTELCRTKPRQFQLTESANLRSVVRAHPSNGHDALRSAYDTPTFI
jgi:hypothetical protein